MQLYAQPPILNATVFLVCSARACVGLSLRCRPLVVAPVLSGSDVPGAGVAVVPPSPSRGAGVCVSTVVARTVGRGLKTHGMSGLGVVVV